MLRIPIQTILTLALFLPLIGCTTPEPTPWPTPTPTLAPSSTPAILPLAGGYRPTRGVNMGNALEAPYEGEWGMVLEESYFAAVAEAGFDAVRIPIRWSNHAADAPPYAIDEGFFERVDWAIAQCLDRDLLAVVNVHHYDELIAKPSQHKARFLALWRQIAERYADEDERLYFELLNEPNGALSPELWNDIAAEALAMVRESNPTRGVIVGPGQWNNLNYLGRLELPDDPHLIVTFHYYEPFQFTHQGAEWVDGSNAWMGTTWDGTESQKRAITNDLETAVRLAARHGWYLYMGEFGVYSKADMASRARWTRFLTREAEERGISWSYWEFGAGFGVYDRDRSRWREELLEALVLPQ